MMVMPINNGLAMYLFGELPSEALKNNRCVKCKKPAIEFRDAVSEKEYRITALCQSCQDEFYESEDE